MSASQSFSDLIVQLRAGDELAAEQIVDRCAHQIFVKARGKLSERLRQRVDPEDIVQSVFKSFFVRHQQGKIELRSWEELWGLLLTITERKCTRAAEHNAAQRRTMAREVSPTQLAAGSSSNLQPYGRDPTPSEAAILAETLDQLLLNLDDVEQCALLLRLEGYTVLEISEQLGRSERSVERFLARARKHAERLQNGGV